MKECKYLSVDDCCMEDNPCGLIPCQHIKGCYYKQLLAEQAKNKELEDILKVLGGKTVAICEFDKPVEFWGAKDHLISNLQAKNKKLVEALEKIAYRDITIKSNFYSSTVANEALNEVNNAK